jgi:cathepsin C
MKKNNEDDNIWSMVYNEGFEIRYKKIVLFVFNEYFKKDEKWYSNCGKSLIGWYKNTLTNEYGCV